MSNNIKLKVGQKYRDRNGDVWLITAKSRDFYPFDARDVKDPSRRRTFLETGRFDMEEEGIYDLVELIEDVKEVEAQEEATSKEDALEIQLEVGKKYKDRATSQAAVNRAYQASLELPPIAKEPTQERNQKMSQSKQVKLGQVWETNKGNAVLISSFDNAYDRPWRCERLEQTLTMSPWLNKEGCFGDGEVLQHLLFHPIKPEHIKCKSVQASQLTKGDVILYEGREGQFAFCDTDMDADRDIYLEDGSTLNVNQTVHLVYRNVFPKLEVGQTWLTRKGDVITIKRYDEDDDIYFDSIGKVYVTPASDDRSRDLIVLLNSLHNEKINAHFWPWEPDCMQRKVRAYLKENNIDVTFFVPSDYEGNAAPFPYPKTIIAESYKEPQTSKEPNAPNPTPLAVANMAQDPMREKTKRYPKGKVTPASALASGDVAMVQHHGVWVEGLAVIPDHRIGRPHGYRWVINRETGLYVELAETEEVVLVRREQLPTLLPMQRWVTRGGETVTLKPTEDGALHPYHPSYDEEIWFTHDPFCLEDEDWDLVQCLSESKPLLVSTDVEVYAVDKHIVLMNPKEHQCLALRSDKEGQICEALEAISSHLFNMPMTLVATSLVKG